VLFPGSAETNVGRGGKLNGHLMARCVRNICTKNYQNLIIVFQVRVKNVGNVFLRHSVVHYNVYSLVGKQVSFGGFMKSRSRINVSDVGMNVVPDLWIAEGMLPKLMCFCIIF